MQICCSESIQMNLIKFVHEMIIPCLRREVLASAVVAPGVGEPVGRQEVHVLIFSRDEIHLPGDTTTGRKAASVDVFHIMENISCRLSVLDPVVFTQNDELGIDRNPLPHVICVICVLISDAFGHPTSMPTSQRTSQPCRQITFFPWYEVVWRPVAERTKWRFICAISSNIRAAEEKNTGMNV